MSDLARTQLGSGEVRAALDTLKADVRKAPREPRLRTFLFQMFCITGEWDRALTQLKVVGDLDPAAEAMVTTYGAAIRCELLREKVFRGERTPTVFGQPEPWVPLLIESNRLLATGEADAAADLRDQAFDLAPATAVTADGTASGWIADADPRLGPVLEALIDGRYMWIPFARLAKIAVDAPADLRDQVWMPATVTFGNGGETVALIPTRYPGSATSADPLIQLARKTDWQDRGEHWSLPLGQRMLVTEDGEIPLMDVREITLSAAAQAEPAPEDADRPDADRPDADRPGAAPAPAPAPTA